MPQKTSLKDIAKKAGVSVTLVSYVLNHQKENRIRKETAENIRKVAARLNYSVNQLARSLKTNKSLTIGLIVADISNPFFSKLASIIETEAELMDYTVIFGSSHESANKFSKLKNTFLNRQVDGMIIAPPQDAEDQIRQLRKQRMNFVLVDRYFPGLDTDYVVLDNYDASFRAVNHMINSGRKRVGMIGYKTDLAHLKDRKSGYLASLKANGITFKKSWFKEVAIGNDKSEIENALKELLSHKAPVDSILFASNTIATYAVKYINTLPIKVPEQLSLLCFDETEALDLFYAPLSYIRQPLEQMGQLAIQILLEKLNKKSKRKQLKVKSELVIRNSV